MRGIGDPVAIGYMCKTDFDCELGHATDGNVIYPSVKTLRESLRCTHECGIVRVRVILDKVVQPENRDYRNDRT